MADPNLPPQAPAVQVPLLNSNNHRENQGTDLDRVLDRLEKFLTFLGFKQSSTLRFFAVLGGFCGGRGFAFGSDAGVFSVLRLREGSDYKF
ncbi:hypothetical protein SLA2020_406660 [Shorea laevis]